MTFLKKLLLLLLFLVSFSEFAMCQDYLFANEKKESTNWKHIDVEEFLSYEAWLQRRYLRDQDPLWRFHEQMSKRKELMALLVKCSGYCRVYREDGHFTPQFRSKLDEGDEFETGKDSQAWILLADGSLIRISPESSVSFIEFNKSKQESLAALRVNQGHLKWMPRYSGEYQFLEKLQTDQLALPLNLNMTHPMDYVRTKYQALLDDERALFLMQSFYGLKELVNNLNKTLAVNDTKWGQAKVHQLLFSPNATIKATNAVLDMYYDIKGQSHLRYQSKMASFKIKDHPYITAELSLRGYAQAKVQKMNSNEWYIINPSGRSFKTVYKNDWKKFGISDYLVSYIPALFLARELLLEKYFAYLWLPSEQMTPKKLAESFGLYFWEEKDFFERADYLQQYIRRVETTHLYSVFKVYQHKAKSDFDIRYVRKALLENYRSYKKWRGGEFAKVLKMSDIQYHFWKHHQGQRHVSTRSR